MSNRSPISRSVGRAHLYQPLGQQDFLRLKHAASLKGLLKPFTDKGELADWGRQCESLRDELIRLSQHVVSQTTAYPFSRLPIVLAQQTTSAGTAFLRWRKADRSAMGVALWIALMDSAQAPEPLVHDLFALERDRIVLNLQISLTHSIAQQANACADKMARAEALYRRRAVGRCPNTHRGVTS